MQNDVTAESRAGQYKHFDIENTAAHLHWHDRRPRALTEEIGNHASQQNRRSAAPFSALKTNFPCPSADEEAAVRADLSKVRLRT
jgi:hypothetical protein